MGRYRTFILVFVFLHSLATIATAFEAQQAARRRLAGDSATSSAYEARVGALSRALTFPVPQLMPWFFALPLVGRFWFALPGILWATALVCARLAWDRRRAPRRAAV